MNSVTAPARDRALSRGALCVGVVALALAHAQLLLFEPGVGESEGLERALFEPTSAAPLAVIVCWLWMLWVRGPRLRGFAGQESPALGAMVLAAGGALSIWAHYVAWLPLLVPSLAIASLGSALLLSGARAMRTLLYPAAFLMLAMPLPTPLVNAVAYPAQLANAAVVGWALSWVGFDVSVWGDLIRVDDTIAQVIEGCTGLRSLMTTLMAACIYTELTWHDRGRSLVLIGLSPLIAILANFIRILSIIFNPFASLSTIHTAQGLIMIVGSVFLLALVDVGLARVWKTEAQPHLVVEPARGHPSLAVSLAFAFMTVAIALACLAGPRWSAPADRGDVPLTTILNRDPGWAVTGFKPDYQFLGSVRFDTFIAHRMTRPGSPEVKMLVAADHRLDPALGLGSRKAAIPGRGGEVLERPPSLSAPYPWMDVEIVRLPGETRLVYFWSKGRASLGHEVFRSTLALDRGPFRRPGRAAFVQLSTPIHGGLAKASRRLAEVVETLRPDFVNTGLWMD